MLPLASNRVVTAPAVPGATRDAPAAISKPAHNAHQICKEVDTGPPTGRRQRILPATTDRGLWPVVRGSPDAPGPTRTAEERPLRLCRRLAANPVQDPKHPGLELIHRHPVLLGRRRDLILG